ncbi:UDP-N-acetylmuramate--L-alanine ligase [Patescibacteria group bacterium]|nr:UDP-N-acetylmuramate--L-alanine ligase [Patescibacteria group bacterium]
MDFAGKKIHLVGVKGVGMTALAQLLQHHGAIITGSDIQEEFHTDHVLKRLKIKPLNFSARNITPDINMIIYSSAYPETHPERQKAASLKIPQRSYAQTLAKFFNAKKGIMVAGTHGKTTTTALLGHLLTMAGFDPTVIVGGVVVNWGSNTRIGKSEWMIIEGDEYQKKFLMFKPSYLLITNIDYDHPDTFPTPKSYRHAFRKLISRTKIKHFMRGNNMPIVTMGGLIGKHNRENIALVMQFAKELHIDDKKISRAIKTFKGVQRRTEIYYRDKNVVIIDDYAHHPEEIKATLSAIRDKYSEHIIKVVFQPHTYSRTKALLHDFAVAFVDSDELILLPTYSSAREGQEIGKNIDKLLFQNIQKHQPASVFGMPRPIKKILKDKRKIVVLTMGAGDVWQIAKKLTGILNL